MGLLAILLARTRRILMRYFAMVISIWTFAGPLSWWSASIALIIVYAISLSFLLAIMFKGNVRGYDDGEPWYLLRNLLNLSA